MNKIHLITPPDKLFNNATTVTLIYPSNVIKEQFQNKIEESTDSINVYIYELEETEHNVDWLLSVCKMSDYVIFDIDNSEADVRTLASYIISNSNVYWLTNAAETVYTYISPNRVYDLSFLKLGGEIEKT